MGETQKIEITFDPEALGALMRQVAETARIAATPAAEPEHALTPYDLGLAPWVFHDPRQGCDVMAYVDDREQVRHVPSTRATEVPASWRRVWLQPRS
jgi:hypothetical protein